MRHFVITDLEGVAGVWRWMQTRDEGALKQAAMRLLTGEANACVDGILEADAEGEIVVLDGHGARGLIFEELHARARMLPGEVRVRDWLGRHGADAVYFVGQHAMAGTPEAPLCHTYSSLTVAEYRLNGRPAGEFGCIAALAGEFGVTTVFLSGDDRAAAEARALVPELVTVEVKEGIAVEAALHLSHQEACRRIRAGAGRAAARIAEIPPVRLPPPYTLRIELLPGRDVAPLLARGGEPDGERAAVFRADRLRDLPNI